MPVPRECGLGSTATPGCAVFAESRHQRQELQFEQKLTLGKRRTGKSACATGARCGLGSTATPGCAVFAESRQQRPNIRFEPNVIWAKGAQARVPVLLVVLDR